MNETETVRLPLWKNCLEKMREAGMTYGRRWKADFFEAELRAPKESPAFAFEMLALKECIEKEDGFYLKSSENGKVWSIPSGEQHEDVCERIERGIRKDSVRVINLRSATLLNPEAQLGETARKRMEKNLERAATRLVLISRTASVEKVLKEKAPNLLERKQEAP